MPIVAEKKANFGTTLTGPELPVGIVPVTITAVNDLGYQPNFDKTGDVRQVEFVFETAKGEQGKYIGTVSNHEKSFCYKIAVAISGKPPADDFDYETARGKKVILMTSKRPQTVGKNAGKLKLYIDAVAAGAGPVPTGTNVGF